MKTWEKITALALGVVFITAILVLAILIPNPTETQFFVFRVIISAAIASVVGIVVNGKLRVDLDTGKRVKISTGGAIGVFVIVFLVNPPALIKHAKVNQSPPAESLPKP